MERRSHFKNYYFKVIIYTKVFGWSNGMGRLSDDMV